MKIIGVVLTLIGIVLCIFALYSFLKEQSKVVSPVPETEGVKVILISPSE